MSNLVKELRRIAAKELHNTRGIPQNMNAKIEYIELAWGHAEIVEDFRRWCQEPDNRQNPYPVTAYLRQIDSRLGHEPAKPAAEDPQVKELQSFVYESAEFLPNVKYLRELLAVHSLDDIKHAFREYLLVIGDANRATALKNFFENDGAGAVIAARKKRVA